MILCLYYFMLFIHSYLFCPPFIFNVLAYGRRWNHKHTVFQSSVWSVGDTFVVCMRTFLRVNNSSPSLMSYHRVWTWTYMNLWRSRLWRCQWRHFGNFLESYLFSFIQLYFCSFPLQATMCNRLQWRKAVLLTPHKTWDEGERDP